MMMKKSIFILLSAILASQAAYAHDAKSHPSKTAETVASTVKSVSAAQLTSHVLDINAGIPAANVKIQLKKLQADGSWKLLDTQHTNDNGRIRGFLPKSEGDEHANDGTYKLVFDTAEYYGKRNIPTFYPYVEVVFNMQGGKHFHVPITLSPFGYSTYRGS